MSNLIPLHECEDVRKISAHFGFFSPVFFPCFRISSIFNFVVVDVLNATVIKLLCWFVQFFGAHRIKHVVIIPVLLRPIITSRIISVPDSAHKGCTPFHVTIYIYAGNYISFNGPTDASPIIHDKLEFSDHVPIFVLSSWV